MKKFILLGAIFFGILMTEQGYSQNANFFGNNDSACCPPKAEAAVCQDQGAPTGECYRLMKREEPVYSNEWKCHEENVYTQRKCCRYVKCPYEVKRCRYVPQYYTETCYKSVPEYYYVTDCKPCKKWHCEKKCTMVPKYYWKHICGDKNAQVAKPACVK